jgi:hypothetical protein
MNDWPHDPETSNDRLNNQYRTSRLKIAMVDDDGNRHPHADRAAPSRPAYGRSACGQRTVLRDRNNRLQEASDLGTGPRTDRLVKSRHRVIKAPRRPPVADPEMTLGAPKYPERLVYEVK